MKKLKLLFLTLFSVISLSVFSQTQVYTTNTTGPNICNGTAMLDTSNINLTSIYWQGMGAIINQGSYIITNLCPGSYAVTFTINGTSTTLGFTITAGTSNPCLNFGGFLTPTNSVDSTTCDGVITATVTGGQAPYTYLWSIATTTQTISNLCPGSYCCYVSDANGCTANICDTIGVQSPNFGDTLIVNGVNCINPQGTIFNQVEDCNFNYNAVDTAYLAYIDPTPMGITIVWAFIDTNGVMTTIQSYDSMVNTNGCYDFSLILFCSQKSVNIKTIIVTDSYDINFVSINELSMNQRKLIKVIDLMGKTTQLEPNRFLIMCYNDGTTEKVFINE